MDVFGSSPFGKMNNIIRDSNRYFDNRLSIHRELINDSSEKINTLITSTEDMKNKLITQCMSIDENSKNINTLCMSVDENSKNINTLTTSTEDLKNKFNIQSVLISDSITGKQDGEKKLLETTSVNLKSDAVRIPEKKKILV